MLNKLRKLILNGKVSWFINANKFGAFGMTYTYMKTWKRAILGSLKDPGIEV